MIKNLFYFLYWFYTKSKAIQNPSIVAFSQIIFVLGFNFATLLNILLYFLGLSLVNKGIDGGFWGLIIGITIMIINYFAWYNKRKIIIARYEQMPRKEKVRRSIFAITYVVVSLLCFYFSTKAAGLQLSSS